MGSYYKNRIMISKRENKEGVCEDFTNNDFENIKDVFVEVSKSRDVFEEDIQIIEELLNFDEMNKYDFEKSKYSNSVVINYECYSEVFQSSKLYLELTFKYMNYSDVYSELNNKLKRNYQLQILSNETYSSTPKSMLKTKSIQFDLEKKLETLKNILIDIGKDDCLNDDVIKKIVSSNDKDIIKSSVRNKNISDETLDLILNWKVS
ncbi:MAG: hypothetical protein NTW78_06205 [Campylobacterales bacterium]|nr:hypothetical protein [Campylobacterales bacterium]